MSNKTHNEQAVRDAMRVLKEAGMTVRKRTVPSYKNKFVEQANVRRVEREAIVAWLKRQGIALTDAAGVRAALLPRLWKAQGYDAVPRDILNAHMRVERKLRGVMSCATERVQATTTAGEASPDDWGVPAIKQREATPAKPVASPPNKHASMTDAQQESVSELVAHVQACLSTHEDVSAGYIKWIEKRMMAGYATEYEVALLNASHMSDDAARHHAFAVAEATRAGTALPEAPTPARVQEAEPLPLHDTWGEP